MCKLIDMKASELRKGNLTEHGEVKSFFEHGIHIGYGKCYIFSELLPIPLTGEWMLKLGFEYWKDAEGVTHNQYFKHPKLNEKIVYYLPYFNLSYYIGSKTITYVHEIQNFFFALTGEELNHKA